MTATRRAAFLRFPELPRTIRRASAGLAGLALVGAVSLAQPEASPETDPQVPPAAPAAAPAPSEPAPPPEGNPSLSRVDVSVLASREIGRIALMDLRLRPAPSSGDYEIAASLLAIAQSFAPEDAELLRRRIEAAYAMGDEATVVSLSRRLLQLDPADESAMLRVISANIARLQTIEARLEAYRRLVGPEGASLPAPVRSRLAVDAALLLRERGQAEGFAELVSAAVQLDSTNKTAATLALNFFVERRPDDLIGRLELMRNLLYADPLDPKAHIELYRMAAEAGAYNAAASYQPSAMLILRDAGVTDLSAFEEDGLALIWRLRGPEVVVERLNAELVGLKEQAGAIIRAREAAGLPTGEQTTPEDTRLPFSRELFRLLAAEAAGDRATIEASGADYSETTQEALRDLTEAVQNETDRARSAEISRRALAQLTERFAFQSLVRYRVNELEAGLRSLQQVDLPPAATEVLRGFLLLAQGQPAEAAAVFDANPGGLPTLRPFGVIQAYLEAGRLEEAAELAGRLERSQPLTVFGSWAWSKRRDALGGEVPVPEDIAFADRALATWPRWLNELFEGPRRFMHLEVRPLERSIDPLGSVRVRVELRNVSTVPMGLGTSSTINSKLLLTTSVDAGVGRLGDLGAPEVLHLDRRLRLLPRESIVAELDADPGVTGWIAQIAADETVRHRVRALQAFRIGEDALYEEGPFALSAQSDNLVRLRLPESRLTPDQLVVRAKDGPVSRLPWVAAAVRSGLFALGEGLTLEARDAQRVAEALAERYPSLPREVRAALLSILPHSTQFEAMRAFDEAALRETDPPLRALALATRADSVEHPALGAAASEGGPALARFALLLAERLRNGGETYATVGPDPETLRGGAALR